MGGRAQSPVKTEGKRHVSFSLATHTQNFGVQHQEGILGMFLPSAGVTSSDGFPRQVQQVPHTTLCPLVCQEASFMMFLKGLLLFQPSSRSKYARDDLQVQRRSWHLAGAFIAQIGASP